MLSVLASGVLADGRFGRRVQPATCEAQEFANELCGAQMSLRMKNAVLFQPLSYGARGIGQVSNSRFENMRHGGRTAQANYV